MMKKRVLIIGAGASGLPAIKCCLEDGLEPVCFELSGDIGGLWNYENILNSGSGGKLGCVMKSTIINTSKEMMCYSDYPIPAEYPNFMHNTLVQQYLNSYADNFKLKQHIHLNTEVVQLKPVEDFSETGRWEAVVRDLKTNKERTEIFDAAMICTGHHAKKYMAHFEGEENFKGTRVHTHDFHDSRGYDGKRVVVIGVGNSGGDVVVELSRICSQVYLSTRRGSWVTNRIAGQGLPVDMVGIRRVVFDIRKYLPSSVINSLVERQLNSKFDHSLYGLKPAHRFDAQHVMVNDDLPNAIAAGRVIVKSNVRRLTETGVEFVDGTVVDNVDVVVYATGYEFGFPFINHKALEVIKNDINLYKFVFPPDIKPSTLAIIGCFQPLGAIFPISEMQCRWVTRVFKGEIPLASADDMWNDIKTKKVDMQQRFYASQRHTIQVDYATFMDELAELAGCRPALCELFKTDPRLAFNMYFGPLTPCQYRVMGHGSWDGARNAILTTWQRFERPFKTINLTNVDRCNNNCILIIAFSLLVLAIIVMFLL